MVRVLCVFAFALLLTACAITRSSGPQDITQVTAWKMWGRVIIHTADRSQSANVYWEQHEQDYHIDLFGPLGLGGVRLSGSPNKAVLIDSHDRTYQASSAEALMQQQLGWSIPISDLYYWVRGLPVPNSLSCQQDCQIHYDSYQSLGGLTWPKKMRIETHGVSVILIIHDVEPL